MIGFSILALLSSFAGYDYSEEVCYEMQSVEEDVDIVLEGYEEGEPIAVQGKYLPYCDRNNKPFILESKAALNFIALAKQANREGYKVKVNSAFRTKKEQKQMLFRYGKYNKSKRKGAAKVGYSEHQSGKAIDVAFTKKFIPLEKINDKYLNKKYCVYTQYKNKKGYKCPTEFYWWLKKNAPRYGYYFTNSETHHLTFLGIKPRYLVASK